MNSINFGIISVNGAKSLINMMLILVEIFPSKNLDPPFNKWDTGYLKGEISVLKFLFFRFSPQFIQSLYQKFDFNRDGRVQFDGFVHSIIMIQVGLLFGARIWFLLKRLTGAFQQYDVHRNGNAQFTYEQYLSSVIGSI